MGEDTRLTTYEARVSVSVPLYQSGAVYSRLRSARQTVVQNRQNLEAERRTAPEAVTREWEPLVTARAAIEAFRSQVTANEIALDGVRREAAVGSRTVLDVLDAEQELLDSRVNLVRAQRDQIVAIYGVKSASGALTPAPSISPSITMIRRSTIGKYATSGLRKPAAETRFRPNRAGGRCCRPAS
jgi:outer membrane protein